MQNENSDKLSTIEKQQSCITKIRKLLSSGTIDLDYIGRFIPGFVHINSRIDLSMKDINKVGQQMLGYSLQQIQAMGPAMLVKHQSAWTINTVYPRLFMHFATPGQSSPFTFIQDWIFHERVKKKYLMLSTTHILNEEDYLTFTIPVEAINKLNHLDNYQEHHQELFDKHYQDFQLLSKREKQILQLIANNYTKNQICDHLTLSYHTVKKHTENIYKKLGTNSKILINELSEILLINEEITVV